MTKQKITIEVDVPEGWELTGRHIVQQWEKVAKDELECEVSVKLKRSFVWPTWLKAAAIAKNAYGLWCAFRSVPVVIGDGWHADSDDVFVAAIQSFAFDTSSFPDCDWRESLRINPNYKAE